MTITDITPSNSAIDTALKEAFSHIRDVSLRDGIQSWDSNKWRIDDVLEVAKELNQLAVTAKEHGIEMNPVEIWGGGQFAQPAMHLQEEPFINLEKIKEVTPDLRLQCLYRGKQGLGFKPISDEIQFAAIEASADRGIQVFRIFDMMNDIENVKTSIKAVNDYKQKHPEKNIQVEGAVSYISEPEGEKRAWTLPEYAQYAVEMAKLGCDAIAIKDYAGVGNDELPDLGSGLIN